jgi:hypothetical protein
MFPLFSACPVCARTSLTHSLGTLTSSNCDLPVSRDSWISTHSVQSLCSTWTLSVFLNRYSMRKVGNTPEEDIDDEEDLVRS